MQVKKLKYFLKKALRDISRPMVYEVNNIGEQSNTVDRYYLKFNQKKLLKGGSYNFKFDEQGIPIIKGNSSDNDENYYYNPQAICQFALAVHDEFCNSGCKTQKKYFLTIANWLLDNVNFLDGIPYWKSTEKRYNNIYSYDEINKISSMSQSRVISVLLRADTLSRSDQYFQMASKAVEAYYITYQAGSFLINNDERLCFEENGMPGILNHHIFSMFGLFDYCIACPSDDRANKALIDSIISLKKNLNIYDTGWWSLYDNYKVDGIRRFNPATRHYHQIHVSQLLAVYYFTGDKYFLEMSLKFQKYDTVLNRLKMLFYKIQTIKEMGRI